MSSTLPGIIKNITVKAHRRLDSLAKELKTQLPCSNPVFRVVPHLSLSVACALCPGRSCILCSVEQQCQIKARTASSGERITRFFAGQTRCSEQLDRLKGMLVPACVWSLIAGHWFQGEVRELVPYRH
ncbi:MAG: hypothetical protein OXC07_12670 [Kistimonas sp.]|nr:hypothetical protein [Kistimonas sp.]